MEILQRTIEEFIAGAAQPVLLDSGEEPLRLAPDRWNLTNTNGRLVIQAWDDRRNLVRRIIALKDGGRHRLSLITERFPKTRAEMTIADLAAPSGAELERRTTRLVFRERFQLMLAREYPAWKIEEASSEPNLRESLTSCYTRAFLRLGAAAMAAVAAAPDAGDIEGILPAGLIWLEYLRRREKGLSISTLLLYVPQGREQPAAFRAAVVSPARVDLRLFAFDTRDRCGEVELADAGNVESSLPPARQPLTPNADPPRFPTLPGVERIDHSDGSIALRVRGLEFARWSPGLSQGKLTCGIARRRRCSMETVEATAREILRIREPGTADPQHPLYLLQPEGWLESQVRAQPQVVDSALLPSPLYGQVLVFAGANRGIIDLLGIDHTGRLVVLELKAAADHQLPFQAIDYWLRVRKHLFAGDFERLGYFPGRSIRRDPPRIVLVAPALEFHSTSEAMLSHLAPSIEITRVGLAAGWREELRVMFRLQGADRPS